MPDYIDREQAVDLVSRMEEDNDGTVGDEFYAGYCAGIERAVSGLEDMEPERVRPIKQAKWDLKVRVGHANDYHVEAFCSNCGWQWENEKEGVGNPKAVYGAFFTNGTEQERHAIVLSYAWDKRLYDYCPVCGSIMYDDVLYKEMEKDEPPF